MARCMFIPGVLSDQVIKSNFEILSENTGATATFDGIVRADEINGKRVVAIEFSTSEEIAQSIAENILEKAVKEYSLTNAKIYHSVGKVNAGQRCFKVEVYSAHRKEAFLALPKIVNHFKSKVPIFGKEVLEDSTYVWKTNRI